jgi:hypothetical protein
LREIMMSIKSLIDDFKRYQKDVHIIQNLEKENKILKQTQIQLSSEILSIKADEQTNYKSNQYSDYRTAVQEINDKYTGVADWGVFQTGNIIDLRGAFILSEGIKVQEKVKGQGQAELQFATDFLQYNDLDKEIAQEFAKEAEIEGKILLRLFYEKKDNQVSARYVSWLTKNYTVKTNPLDYLDVLSVEWTEKDKLEKIEYPEFVYKKFGGRVNEPNSAVPKIMKCLSKIDDLDKALRDLREINRIFSAPIFTMQFDSAQDAKKAQEDIDKMNWKIKKALCHNAKEIGFKQPDMTGVDNLVKEIITLAKMISGSTGIPVHFLGLPELLSNRATAENLMELIYASTLKERETWKGAYQELISKAIDMMNTQTGEGQKSTKLDASRIVVDIPFISAENWNHIEKILLPLSIAGKITDELLLSKIPGIDVDEEMKRKQAESEFKKKNAPTPFPFDNVEKTVIPEKVAV